MEKDSFDYAIAIISAIGALITLPLTIISIIKLIKRDEQKQDQIDRLALMIEELKSQNGILTESNLISTQQVSLLAKFVTQSSETQKIQLELIQLEKRKHKLSIRPDIKIDPNRGILSGPNDIQIPFFNHNAVATEVLVSPNAIQHSNITVRSIKIPELKKGESFQVILTYPDAKYRNEGYEFDISFNDADQNKYLLKVRGTGTNVGVNPIIEIES